MPLARRQLICLHTRAGRLCTVDSRSKYFKDDVHGKPARRRAFSLSVDFITHGSAAWWCLRLHLSVCLSVQVSKWVIIIPSYPGRTAGVSLGTSPSRTQWHSRIYQWRRRPLVGQRKRRQRERQPSTCSWHRHTLSFQLQLKPSSQWTALDCSSSAT